MKDGVEMWAQEEGNVRFYFKGSLIFEDTSDHWLQGVCRLMAFDESDARKWVAHVAAMLTPISGEKATYAEKLRALESGSQHFFSERGTPSLLPNGDKDGLLLSASSGPAGIVADTVFQLGIGMREELAVVGNRDLNFGWLVGRKEESVERKRPLEYDASFYEEWHPHHGYSGDYGAEASWRIDKARRQVDWVERVCRFRGVVMPKRPTCLDVGSGYGYFRQAIAERGWRHYGTEISQHAARECHERYGFKTAVGAIGNLSGLEDNAYDLITLWDVIEHVSDPLALLRQISELLSDGGVCVIRTPNLCAVEHQVFGRFYHSLKRDHLCCFSPLSILTFATSAGLHVVQLETEAHLLKGFLGDDVVAQRQLLSGSDIMLVARKRGVSESDF